MVANKSTKVKAIAKSKTKSKTKSIDKPSKSTNTSPQIEEEDDLNIEPEPDDAVLSSEDVEVDIDDLEIDDAELNETKSLEKEVEDEFKHAKEALQAAEDESTISSDPVRDYLRQIGSIELLAHEQEKDLASRIEVGLYAQNKVDSGASIPQEDMRYVKWMIEDGKRAKKYLIEANLRLVVSLAKKYSKHGMRFQDLIQEGNMGLVRAVDKYDYSTTWRFSTYATWWIRQSITRAMADQGRTIRIPVHMVEIINNISREQRKLTVELGRAPTSAELAEHTGVPIERILEIQRYAKTPSSLFTTLSDDGETEIGDLIEDTSQPDHIEVVTGNYMHEQLFKVLDTLSDKERDVIAYRYGLSNNHRHTLDEIGAKLNVTRERVRQIEQKTMAKLRHPSRSMLLKEFFGR